MTDFQIKAMIGYFMMFSFIIGAALFSKVLYRQIKDIITNDFANKEIKWTWFCIVVFIPLLGSVVYHTIGKYLVIRDDDLSNNESDGNHTPVIQ